MAWAASVSLRSVLTSACSWASSLARRSSRLFDDDAPPLEFELSYRPRNRVLNISFVEPFEAYRSVEVTFSDKIMTRDGATLVPYTLSFSTGGS